MFAIGPPRTEAVVGDDAGDAAAAAVNGGGGVVEGSTNGGEAGGSGVDSGDDGEGSGGGGGRPFCRLCFTKSDDLCPLFPPATIPNKTLLHKIFDCTTVTLSFRDDHNAQICSGCVVNIEAFFKYKLKCVENDKLLRKRRTSFFSGLGLTADPATVRASGVLDDEEKQLDRELLEKAVGAEENSKTGSEADSCLVKQELIDDEDDDDGYFNPDQFLAQETQIGDKQIDQSSLNGSGYDSGNSGFERGWKTTEFSPQPGLAGLKPLKITDYSNLTGKRGRPQKFLTMVPTERLLAPPRPHPYPNPNHPSFHTSSPLPRPHLQQPPQQPPSQQRGFESAYRQHLGLANGNNNSGRPLPQMPATPPSAAASLSMSGNRFEPYPMSTAVEQTRKVQKFLDDGLRDLILNAGAPNPNFALDGGYTSFKVVKARCNSYNLIFEANRFLRRNKSCSGLPKWYWACSINGCPVKVCSYRGRLFKTNDKINHIHPPSETDESHHEVVLPHQIDVDVLGSSVSSSPATPPSQSQIHRQLQQQVQQRQFMKVMAAAAAASTAGRDPIGASLLDDSSCSNQEEEVYEDASAYEIVKGEEEKDAVMLYKNLKYQLEKVEEDGVKIWKCATSEKEEEGVEVVSETIHQLVDGRIKLEKKIKKQAPSGEEEDDDYGPYDDDAEGGKRKNSRPPKIAVYEGYHYKYCHARPEGTFYWRCVLKNETVNCPASLHTKATFEFLNFNDQTHNHDPPAESVKLENAIVCMIKPSTKPPTVPPVGSTDFQLVKSGQKREFLIYQGYRYYFQYESKNGKRSYRCTMFRNCPAGAFLMPDNTIAEAKNFVHTHPPTENLEKYVTKDSLITSPIKDVDGQPRRQQQTLAESGAFPMLNEQPDPRPAGPPEDVAAANGYKIILNYKNKEILIYNGWRYFVDYKKKNGGGVWRCSSHRLCRGAVHLFPDGSINFAKLVEHNHMPPRRNLSGGNLSLESGSRPTDISLDGSFNAGMLHELSSNAYAPPCHRFISHQGHRFRFATRKREGTIYWRCAMRLETKCPVSFHTKEDTYELVSMRNHEHNHGIPTVWPEIAGGTIQEELPVVKMPREEIGTMDYILTKNSKGRDVILYQNGRYYLDYSRKDGKIVFRCSAVAGCRAMVLLLPNKTLQVSRELAHTHPPLPPIGSLPPQQQHHMMMQQRQHLQQLQRHQQHQQQQQLHSMSSASSSAPPPQMNLSASMSMDTGNNSGIEIKSDDECQLVAPPDPLDVDQPAADAAAAASAAPSSSSSDSLQCPNFIVHLGYHYKFVSKSDEERTAYWRCSNYEAKMNCQAAIYTTLAGQVLRNNAMMHNHKAEDYASAAASNSLATRKNMIGSRDYKIVKNWKNRDVLVFQQCRYFLHYVRKDGRKVWRCSAIRSCHAAVYLGADGRVDQVKGEHVHDIRQEGEPRRRRRVRMDGTMMVPPAMPGGNGMPMHHPGNGNGTVPGSAEWIDYSDYGFQMGGADNNSLWDNFNPHQMAGGHPTATAAAPGGSNGADNFDLSYHSVFGGQSGFGDASNSFAHHQQQQLSGMADSSAMDDDDEGLPLEPDVSFAEHEDDFDALHLEPVVQMAADD